MQQRVVNVDGFDKVFGLAGNVVGELLGAASRRNCHPVDDVFGPELDRQVTVSGSGTVVAEIEHGRPHNHPDPVLAD